MKRLLLICAAIFALCPAFGADWLRSLPSQSAIVAGYSAADSVEQRLGELPLCPAEGIWQMADGGALFAIERAEPSTGLAPAELRLVMIRSPWRSIRPGTVLGHAVATPRPGVYEARIYSSFAQRTGLNVPRAFLLTVGQAGSTLTIEPFRSPLKVNLFRLLPYMFRRVVSLQDSRPTGLTGAVKVFPASAAHPLSPVYL